MISVEGATIRAIHTPGHANDHCVFELLEEKALFTGDNVLGTGTPVFKDLPLYMASLEGMLSLSPSRLYTSHGPVVDDAQALIREYISHRNARVEQVLASLRSAGGKEQSVLEITTQIYAAQQLPEGLMAAAALNVFQALRLLEERRVALSINTYSHPLESKWHFVPRPTL